MSWSKEECIQQYSYLVEYSSKDETYIAQCVELGIMAHGDDHEKAIKEIKEATRIHLMMLEEGKEDFPEPLNYKNFSGKLNLRMTPEKHRKIAFKAKQMGVSINQYINSQL